MIFTVILLFIVIWSVGYTALATAKGWSARTDLLVAVLSGVLLALVVFLLT